MATSNATLNDWLEGARLRTLPAALAPVMLGSAAAIELHTYYPVRILLAAIVALFLQIGVNFSNDYSDGVRGTDAHRVGPQRLTASGKVPARIVLAIALLCFALAGVAGLTLIILSGTWWLLGAGAAAILAAWWYTGSPYPYGYMGLGEVFVFVFFGLLATVGTTWTQAEQAPAYIWLIASAVGFLSCALLMVNNIRDIPTDRSSGKITLAVRLGDRWACRGYAAFLWLAFFTTVLAFWIHPPANKILLYIVLIIQLLWCFYLPRPLRRGKRGTALIAVLRQTGLATLAYGIMVSGLLLR